MLLGFLVLLMIFFLSFVDLEMVSRLSCSTTFAGIEVRLTSP